MKRILAAAAAIALFCALFAACGKTEEPESSQSSSYISSNSSSRSSSSSSSSSRTSSSSSSSASHSSSQSSSSDSESVPAMGPISRPYDGVIPDALQALFDKTLLEIFPDAPEPSHMEGGSAWYLYDESNNTYLLFSPFGEPDENYLQGIAGNIGMLMEGRDKVSVADLKAAYGDRFTVEADMMNDGWVGILKADGLVVFFEGLVSNSDDNITLFRMRIDDSLYG